jgi:hypothetical protein
MARQATNAVETAWSFLVGFIEIVMFIEIGLGSSTGRALVLDGLIRVIDGP